MYLGVAGAERLVIAWYWQTLLVMGLTTLLWIVVALLTRPDPQPLLQDFYKRARPLGFWKPFRNKGELGTYRPLRPILKGIFIAIIGTVSVSLFILGLTHAWFARYGTSLLTLLAAIVLFIGFRKMASGYLKELEISTGDRKADAVPYHEQS